MKTPQEYRLLGIKCFARYDVTGVELWKQLGINWMKLAIDAEKIKTQAIMLGLDKTEKMAA
jgi:hypothetical protein